MKNIKLVLIAALITFTSEGFAKTGEYIGKLKPETMKISLNEALQIPGLVEAMYDQLDESMLENEKGGEVVFKVVYKDILFLIIGNYEEWLKFFYLENIEVEKEDSELKVADGLR